MPQDIKNIFGYTIDTGIDHGTVTVVLDKQNFEVTTYRIDGEYKDNRRPENVTFSKKIEEDLSRRDFTMNAIAYNIKKGFVDPFCGSGTTLVAAKMLNRNFIGVDKNSSAIELCNRRLASPIKTVSRLLQVGEDAYRTKTDEELAILNMLECDVVQRNKGIDGVLKKFYLDAPVAVKIQKSYESFSEAINLLNNAGRKKKCSFTVLIRTAEGLVDSEISLPSNMIVIDGLNLQLNSSLSKELKRYNKKLMKG